METNLNKTLGNEDFMASKEQLLISFTKYEELSDGDNEFLLALLQQTLIEFQQFTQKYPELVELKDEQNLSRLVHKIKPTLILLELDSLSKEIQENRDMLKSSQDINALTTILGKIKIDLGLILKQLEDKIEEITKLIE